MAFILDTASNPGTASWTEQNWIIAQAGVVTFGLPSVGVNTVTVSVPAGLEGSPLLLSWANNMAYGEGTLSAISGGRLYGSITGTTLSVNMIQAYPVPPPGPYPPAGIKVAYTVLRLTV
jgi:hypothetical protein